MRKCIYRTVLAAVAGVGLAIAPAVVASAAITYGYTLSGNGRMEYDAHSNVLAGLDYKSGDYIYIRFAYTNTVCRSAGAACAPDGYGVFRLSRPDKDTVEQIALTPGNNSYVLLQLCNDDDPPDTCSEWKRTAS